MPVSWGLRLRPNSQCLCVSLNHVWEVALTGSEGSQFPLMGYRTGEFLSHMQEKGRREMESMIRIPLLWRSVCVLCAPPEAMRSSAIRRL